MAFETFGSASGCVDDILLMTFWTDVTPFMFRWAQIPGEVRPPANDTAAWKALMGDAELALALLVERFRGIRSLWRHYIAALPQVCDCVRPAPHPMSPPLPPGEPADTSECAAAPPGRGQHDERHHRTGGPKPHATYAPTIASCPTDVPCRRSLVPQLRASLQAQRGRGMVGW